MPPGHIICNFCFCYCSLSRSCGVRPPQRKKRTASQRPAIVNGIEAQPNSWPWVISLRYRTDNRHICGGSIIAETWILTAAHCLHGLSTNAIQVIAGDHVTTVVESAEQLYLPKRFVLHEEYDFNTLHNDIALIELAEPIHYNREIAPVCLPTSLPTPRAICTATGWGLTLRTGNQTHLNELHIPIVPHHVCSSAEYWGNGVTPDMVCAGYQRHSVCRGDSGGSLVWNNNGNSPYSLVGVTSFVAKYCNTHQGTKPSVFTNVYNYLGWIQDNVAGVQPLDCTGYIVTDDGQHCYKYVKMSMNYENAKEFCQAENSYLVEIGSQKEQYFLQGLVGGSHVWIGLQDANHVGRWDRWNSQAPAIYSNWGSGEPNGLGRENCAHMYIQGQWNDLFCTEHRHFVCELGHRINGGQAQDQVKNSNRCDISCQMRPATNCYTYHKEKKNYDEAEATCHTEGGHLIEINSEWEQLFLQGLVGGNYVWIGLQDRFQEGNWSTWNSGTPLSYSNWLQGEPNNLANVEHCAGTFPQKWNDFPCSAHWGFVCENSHIGLPDQLTCNCGIGQVMGTAKVGTVDILCYN